MEIYLIGLNVLVMVGATLVRCDLEKRIKRLQKEIDLLRRGAYLTCELLKQGDTDEAIKLNTNISSALVVAVA